MHKQYLSIIQEKLDYFEDQSGRKPLRFRDDPYVMNIILQLVLRHQDWTAQQVTDWFQHKHSIQVKLSVRGFLARFHLLKPDGRRDCLHFSEDIRKSFLCLLSDDEERAKAAYEHIKNTKYRIRQSWPAVTRMVLINLSNEFEKVGGIEQKRIASRIMGLIQKTLFMLSSNFFNEVVYAIAKARGFVGSETVSEQINGIIEEVSQYETQDDTDDAPDVTLLQEENSDLRAALFGLKHELTYLQSRILHQQEHAQAQAFVNFLSTMNAPTNGQLLDNIVHSSNMITNLLNSNWQPEPEIEGIVYSVKMLTDFLLKIGIYPIKEIGSHEEITMSELPTLNYVGSEFQSPSQRKIVQFRSPGWAYEGQIITRPQAIEVIPKKV
jgi:molecular chaperone GrpE (heat shock protein)